METTKKLLVYVKEIKNGNQTFPVCSAEINGKWYKIKFVRGCANAPTIPGLYDLTINFDNCSVERGRKFINKDGHEGISNPTIWVKFITNIRKYTDEELAQNSRLAMAEIFGDTTDNDLPF